MRCSCVSSRRCIDSLLMIESVRSHHTSCGELLSLLRVAASSNPSVNRTACKLCLQVRSGLRPPPAGYVER
jgi:hypothetical protein